LKRGKESATGSSACLSIQKSKPIKNHQSRRGRGKELGGKKGRCVQGGGYTHTGNWGKSANCHLDGGESSAGKDENRGRRKEKRQGMRNSGRGKGMKKDSR